MNKLKGMSWEQKKNMMAESFFGKISHEVPYQIVFQSTMFGINEGYAWKGMLRM